MLLLHGGRGRETKNKIKKYIQQIYLFLMSAVKCILDKWILYFFDISFHHKNHVPQANRTIDLIRKVI